MAGIFSFKCGSCDKLHEGSPSFACRAPDSFLEQTDKVKEEGLLTNDLCIYTNEDGRYYFIRTILEIPIHGVSEPFVWGVWASVSAENFFRYSENFDNNDVNDRYFAWFANYLPFYENTFGLRSFVRPRAGNERPVLKLQPCNHQLYLDFKNGISIERAQEIAEMVMHGIQNNA